MKKHIYLDVNGYHLQKHVLDQKQLELIKTQLTVVPRGFSYDPNDENIRYSVYVETDDEIIVPRYWGIDTFGIPNHISFSNNTIDINFTGDMRDYQNDVINVYFKHLKKSIGGGLISLQCGGGKTVIAIKIACIIGLKTLIVVHKTFLLEQWKQRIQYFTNAKVGILQQNNIDVDGKDIVIGLIQSICKNKYGSILNQFGFVVYDEAHHVSSKYFSTSLTLTGAKYTLALTATPKRKDGTTNIMYWFLGPPVYVQAAKSRSHAQVKRIKFFSDDPLFVEKTQWSNIKHAMVPSTVKMLTNLCNIESRNKLLCDVIFHLAQSGRTILVVSARVAHLEQLKTFIDVMIRNAYDFVVPKTCFYIGKSTQKEREYAEKTGDVIFGTLTMIKEGLDIPRLNTIVLTSPCTDPEQLSGRVLRKEMLALGDHRPLIVDIIDDLSVFNRHGNERHKFYKLSSFQCSDFYALNTKFVNKQSFANRSDHIHFFTDDVMFVHKINSEDIETAENEKEYTQKTPHSMLNEQNEKVAITQQNMFKKK